MQLGTCEVGIEGIDMHAILKYGCACYYCHGNNSNNDVHHHALWYSIDVYVIAIQSA
jgi:hypothetical protein